MIDDQAVCLALRNQLLTTSGLPSAQAWTNVQFTRTPSTPYIEEDYTMSPPAAVSYPLDGGTIEVRGLYIVRWCGVEGAGAAAIRTGAKAILAKLSAGTKLVASDGSVVRIASRPAPYAGPIRPTGDGWAVCTITIPFWILTSNAVAA